MLVNPRRAFIAVIALTMAMLGASVIACVGDEPGEASKSQGFEGASCFANGTCLTSDLACIAGLCVRGGTSQAPGTDGGGTTTTDGGGTTSATDGSTTSTTCTGLLPLKGAGPSCPPSDVCGVGQKCCAPPGQTVPPACVSNATACNEDLPIVECEHKAHCASTSVCCMEATKTGACAYSLVASRCRTACVGSEIEVCSSSDESCSTGTCRPIRVQAIVAEVSNGACLP